MEQKNLTFESVKIEMLRILKEDLERADSTLETYSCMWNHVKNFMITNKQNLLTSKICDDTISSLFGSRSLESLNDREARCFSAIVLLKNYLNTGQITNLKGQTDLSGPIGDIMMQYILYRKKDRLSGSTISNERRELSHFLSYLKLLKINDLPQIEVSNIIEYLNTSVRIRNQVIKSAVYTLRHFFRYLYEHKIIISNLAAFMPKIGKNQTKLPSVYTPEEVKKIIFAVDRSTAIGKRDYCIILLAALLGIRASDIANLKFENILWENNIISLIQYKTQTVIELPLLSEIGNAIIEYLKYARPKSDSKYIFLLSRSPYTKIGHSTMTQIANKYFIKAKINITNKHHGTHALRHTLATSLLDSHVTLPVISEVLGHSDMSSTSYYLKIDIQSLKKCALEVPYLSTDFYNQKGGYFYEL